MPGVCGEFSPSRMDVSSCIEQLDVTSTWDVRGLGSTTGGLRGWLKAVSSTFASVPDLRRPATSLVGHRHDSEPVRRRHASEPDRRRLLRCFSSQQGLLLLLLLFFSHLLLIRWLIATAFNADFKPL